MTREEEELFLKEMHDSVQQLNKALWQKNMEQFQRLQDVMRRSEEAIIASQALLNKIHRISN